MRRVFLFIAVVILMQGLQGTGLSAMVEIDFESSQGYSTGNLYGQPTGATNTWMGDDTSSFTVTDAYAAEGSHSVRAISYAGNTMNTMYVSGLPNTFTWKFYWNTGTGAGMTSTWLAATDSGYTRYGPWLDFSNYDDKIYYFEGYTRHEIVDLDLPESTWLGVIVVGDISTNTYDVYVNDDSNLVGDDLPFRFAQTSLGYVGISATNTGTAQQYYDAIHIGAVPVPAAVWLLGSGLIGLFRVRKRFK